MITTLIDKQDNFEIVRDQIAAILKTEIESQMQLATDGGKDPNEWDLKIFTERSNPWEVLLNDPKPHTPPIVNIRYDDTSFDPKASNIVERQQADASYTIDCYGYGHSRDDGGAGHVPGDQEAALEAHKAVRLVRNILMAAEYTYLGLRGLVWKRWPSAVSVYQPQIDGRHVQQIVAARLTFRVSFNEESPQVEPCPLESLSTTIHRAENGEILLVAEYEKT